MLLSSYSHNLFQTALFFLLHSVFSDAKAKPQGKSTIQIKLLVASDTLHPKHFKAAVATEALPDPIFYNKYIPIVYQLRVPEWNSESLKLNTSFHCGSDSIKPNFYCPVAYHFDRLLAPLADNMRFSKNIYSPAPGQSYFGNIDCNTIEPHFNHISVAINDVQMYVDKLNKDCPLAKDLSLIVRNLSTLSSSHVTMASNKFNSLMETNKDILNDEFKMVHMAGYIGLQASYILTKYIETIRWTNAFASCQTYRLNIGLVNSYMLQNSLNTVQKSAEDKGYKLSIPSHEYLPHYYKLPLADCIVAVSSPKKTNLVLRVLVPVMKKDTKYTRMRLTKIPYLVTSVELQKKVICEVDGFDAVDEFLIEETPEGSKPVVTFATDQCFENELCFVPEQPRKFVVDPCLKGLMVHHLDTIRDYCSFDCFDIENEEITLPIIMKVAPNQYSITGGPSKPFNKITVFCNDHHFQDLNPNTTNGVMQIILPCSCDLRYKAQIYKSYQPCSDPFEVHYLASIPFLLKPISGNELEEEGTNSSLNGKLEANKIASLKLKSGGEEKYASHSGQFALIWILITLLLTSNGILIYVAFYNRLIHFNMVTGLFSRFGLGSAPTPRSRLNEDSPQQQQQNDNGGWPGTGASLNRL